MYFNYKGKRYSIETSNGQLSIDEDFFPYSILKYNDNILKIKIGNEEKVAFVANDNKFAYVFIDGEQFTIQKVDELEMNIEIEEDKDKNIEYIKPPMPGSVVKLLVEIGQKVEEGAPIIVIEAMKMEITLYSSIDGIVKEIYVSAGQQVDSEQTLVVINRIETN